MKSSDVRILFMGASIISGWRSVAVTTWNGVLEPAGALNIGIPGETSGQLLWRVQHAGFLRGLNPELTVLQIGANDRTLPAHDVAANIRDIVTSSLGAMPRTRIILCAIFPTEKARSPIRLKNDETNALLPGMFEDPRVSVVDHGPLLVDAQGETLPALMPDGLHLSEEGYAVWGSALLPLLGLPSSRG